MVYLHSPKKRIFKFQFGGIPISVTLILLLLWGSHCSCLESYVFMQKKGKHHRKPVPKKMSGLVLPNIIPLSNLCSAIRSVRFLLQTLVNSITVEKHTSKWYIPCYETISTLMVCIWPGMVYTSPSHQHSYGMYMTRDGLYIPKSSALLWYV